MNTKNVADKDERKKLKREARKEAPAKAPRKEARGANKKKVRTLTKGQAKRK